MILRSEMLPLLVKACPSFAGEWELHKAEYADEEDYLPYVVLGRLGNHLIDLHQSGSTEEFPAVFETVELLHTRGDQYVREAVTIGFLESIQERSEAFKPFFGKVTTDWFNQLDQFWNGEIKYVGATFEK